MFFFFVSFSTWSRAKHCTSVLSKIPMTVEIWLTASSFNPFSVGDLLDLIDQVEWLLLRLSFFVRLAQDMLSYLFNACDGLLDERRSDDDAHDNGWIPRAEESRSYEPRNSLLGWFASSKITINTKGYVFRTDENTKIKSKNKPCDLTNKYEA